MSLLDVWNEISSTISNSWNWFINTPLEDHFLGLATLLVIGFVLFWLMRFLEYLGLTTPNAAKLKRYEDVIDLASEFKVNQLNLLKQAVIENDKRAVNGLLNNGADPDIVGDDGQSARTIAHNLNRWRIIRLFDKWTSE